MRTQDELRRRSVFLNIPFDTSYEPLFIALISALVAIGRTPRCVLEVPEEGDGRLSRIFDLIQRCHVSIHERLPKTRTPTKLNEFADSSGRRSQFLKDGIDGRRFTRAPFSATWLEVRPF
jgi:hypothetical protein